MRSGLPLPPRLLLPHSPFSPQTVFFVFAISPEGRIIQWSSTAASREDRQLALNPGETVSASLSVEARGVLVATTQGRLFYFTPNVSEAIMSVPLTSSWSLSLLWRSENPGCVRAVVLIKPANQPPSALLFPPFRL